jgi:hypothetical protein
MSSSGRMDGTHSGQAMRWLICALHTPSRAASEVQLMANDLNLHRIATPYFFWDLPTTIAPILIVASLQLGATGDRPLER